MILQAIIMQKERESGKKKKKIFLCVLEACVSFLFSLDEKNLSVLTQELALLHLTYVLFSHFSFFSRFVSKLLHLTVFIEIKIRKHSRRTLLTNY